MDLFGLERGVTQDPSPQDSPEPGSGASRGSHRLWAFLLVLDSVFVIVFGGAVAAKVYQYWRTPAAPQPAAARRRPAPPAQPAPKPAETPKPAESAAAPAAAAAKPAAPAKAPEPEPAKTVKRGDSPRPPKPSMLTEPPKPRATPALATTGAASGPAAAAGPAAAPSTKAQPVVFKLRADGAKSVQLVGAFIVHGGRKDMTKGGDGAWSVKLYLNHGQYRYFFAVDKKKTLDPENPRSDRGASLLTVP